MKAACRASPSSATRENRSTTQPTKATVSVIATLTMSSRAESPTEADADQRRSVDGPCSARPIAATQRRARAPPAPRSPAGAGASRSGRAGGTTGAVARPKRPVRAGQAGAGDSSRDLRCAIPPDVAAPDRSRKIHCMDRIVRFNRTMMRLNYHHLRYFQRGRPRGKPDPRGGASEPVAIGALDADPPARGAAGPRPLRARRARR